MVKVRVLKTANGEKFYPVTHIKSVIGDNGEMVDVLLGNESAERKSADESLQEQVTATSAEVSTATQNVAELQRHSKPLIYCEVIADRLYLRGEWQQLLNQGYVPYLFRRVKSIKRDKRADPENRGNWVCTKTKSLHYFGREDFVRVQANGKLVFVDRRYTDIKEADKADFSIYRYDDNGGALINPHLNDISRDNSIVVNWSGRCYTIKSPQSNQAYSHRFRWALGFAKPREYRTQTVLPSEVVSTFAEFYITPKNIPTATGEPWEWWGGWTFGV